MPNRTLLNQVVALTEQVANYQLEKFRSGPAGGGNEKAARELVSEVDLSSERMLIDGLSQLLPEAGFHGEETGHSGSRDCRWIIDPLDGTTNYLSGLEQFCISVALYDKEEGQLGVVLRPASHELFCACRGQGLRHNGRPVHCAPDSLPLSSALLGSGFPYRSPDLADSFFACARETLYKCRGLRRFGSAALDLSYVAAGFLQGFWASDLKPYDVAAGLLFLEEAGCTVSNQRGEPYRIGCDRLLVCAPGRVYRELLPIISRHYATLTP